MTTAVAESAATSFEEARAQLRARLSPYVPIDDYAVIGDCRSAALVSRQGSIDWLCLPYFDSPAVFAAILDDQRGGRWVIRPVADARIERRYLPDTAILETTFHTASATLRLRDAMTVTTEADKRRRMWPDHEVLRIVTCTAGEVELEVNYEPRRRYGKDALRLEKRGVIGWACQQRGQLLLLRSEPLLEPGGGGAWLRGRFRLEEGEEVAMSMVFAENEPAVLAPLGQDARDRLEASRSWWQGWAGRCDYRGDYRAEVLRSLVTLKQMCFAPSGALVAAPTTSLPEGIGGQRNWDYRYTWIRDASMTLRTLFDLGYREEAEAFLGWLLHTTRRTRPEIQALYTVFGAPHPKEYELDLEGYAGSRPVRVGNDAATQLQLDAYGELIAAVHEFVRRGGELDRATQRLVAGFGEVVCERWREPDEGIWEMRTGRRHHTSSKVLCWAALDELIEMHENGALKVPLEPFREERQAIRDVVEQRAYNPALGSYVTAFGADDVDASLLLLPIYRYCAFDDERMLRTTELIHERLCDNGFIRRYRLEDGFPSAEGAFAICTFWYIDCRARQGYLDDATRHFDNMLEHGNDVGLYGEEIDPETGMALGNFPQAYSHLALIDAALTLDECRNRRRRGDHGAEGERV